MSKGPIVVERTYNRSTENVWQAITDKDQMREWYFDLKEFKAEPGFEFEFKGGPEDRSYVHVCKVTDVIDQRRLRYSWRYDGYEGISFVTFELFPGGDKTRLRLTHEGVDTFPASTKDFARENFEAGWEDIIGRSLPAFLEKSRAVV